MKILACLALSLACSGAFADCQSSLPLQGTVAIDSCDFRQPGCQSAAEALFAYVQATPDDATSVSFSLQSSPWRMYDPEMRIVTVEEVAALVRTHRKRETRVDLIGSWTGVAPEPGARSLANRVSDALDGFPVRGQDGFLWVSKDGSLRTSRQAFTVRQGRGPYGVPTGKDVMVAMVAGWPSELEADFIKAGEATGLMHAGAGWDIFHLCPERALAAFERAAGMSQPIAAYNAALMRLERGDPGDEAAALALLEKAAALGDGKAKARLEALKQTLAGRTP